MYGFSPFPLLLKICKGSNKYPEKSFFISKVGTGITCLPSVTRIRLAVSISCLVATSCIYTVSFICGNPKFAAIFCTIPSDVPNINILSGLYFLKAFVISCFSSSV